MNVKKLMCQISLTCIFIVH